jgi:glutathione S-transferase
MYGDGFHALVMQNWKKTEDNDVTKTAREELPRWLKILNDHLVDKKYIVGDRFTLADLNVMSVASMSSYVGYDMSAYDNVVSWMKRMAERPAYQKVMMG